LRELDGKIAELRVQNRGLPRDAEGRTAGFVRHPGEPIRMGGEVQGEGSIAGLNVQGIDTIIKMIGRFRRAASTEEDRRATRFIAEGFLDEMESTVERGLYKGDPEVWPILRETRALFAKHKQDFTRQKDDGGVGNAMNQIVKQGATPEDIARMFIGTGKAGNSGLPVRIFDHMERVLGAGNETVGATRQAVWKQISEVRNKAGEIDPMASANAIDAYANSTLARRMNTEPEIDAMRRHAAGLRSLETLIESRASTRAAEEARAAYPQQIKETDAAYKARIKEIEAAQQARTGEAQAAYDDQFGSSAILRKMADGTTTPGETATLVLDVINKQPGNAVRVVKAIKNITGEESEAVSAIQQGIWQKTTSKPEGMDDFGPQAMSQRIFKLVNSDVGKETFPAEHLARMTRFAIALRTAAPLNSNPSGSAWTVLRETGMLRNILTASGLSTLGWYTDNPGKTTAIVGGGVALMLARRGKANRSFGGGAPTQRPPMTDRAAVTTGAGVGLGVGQSYEERP
jgi:hypothetical protein